MPTATERTSKLTNHNSPNYRDFKAAISLYEQCLTINPNQASTLSALGFSHHQIGEMKEALDYYHKAHFINNDDAMVEQLV